MAKHLEIPKYGGYAFMRGPSINPFLERVADQIKVGNIPKDELSLDNLLKINQEYSLECANYQNELFCLVSKYLIGGLLPGQKITDRIKSSGYCDHHEEGLFMDLPLKELTSGENRLLTDEKINFFAEYSKNCPFCHKRLNISKNIFYFILSDFDVVEQNPWGIMDCSARIKYKSIKLAVALTGFHKKQSELFTPSELYCQLTDPIGLRFVIKDKKKNADSTRVCKELTEKIINVIQNNPINGKALLRKNYVESPGTLGFQTITTIFNINGYAYEIQVRSEKMDKKTKIDPLTKDAHYKNTSINEHLNYFENLNKGFENQKEGEEFVNFMKESWPWLVYGFFVAFNQEGRQSFSDLYIADNHLAKTLKIMDKQKYKYRSLLNGIIGAKKHLGIPSHSKLLMPWISKYS